MEKVIELFLEYVQIDTESAEESTTMPSTMKQHDLAALLEKQLREMGAAEIRSIVTYTLRFRRLLDARMLR